ncbi:hypothetical protein ACO0QE_004703 [Hanseniaspora vineae]
MDSKAVLQYAKDLEAMKNQEDKILPLLTTLEKDFGQPTEKILRETKIGVVVNGFKKSTNPEIANKAKRIIIAWKEAITKQKKNKIKTSTSTASSSTLSSSSSSSNKALSQSKDEDAMPEKPRSSKIDGVNTTVHNVKLRDMVIKAVYDALCKESRKPSDEILKISVSIEDALNAFSDKDEKKYKDKYRVVFSNIISKTNKDLKKKILNQDISAEYLVNCDPKDLAPEHLQKKLEEIRKKNLHDAQGATIERSVTDRFQCGKCKERKVSYYQLQTRSADEPLTTFCTCENCGNRWKFS